MKITIKITKEIIYRSRFCSVNSATEMAAENCAIARATREIFPNGYVLSDEICFNDLPTTRIPLPESARIFISRFDAKGPKSRLKMQPFSFEIDVPAEVIEKVGISEVYRVLSESKTLELASI